MPQLKAMLTERYVPFFQDYFYPLHRKRRIWSKFKVTFTDLSKKFFISPENHKTFLLFNGQGEEEKLDRVESGWNALLLFLFFPVFQGREDVPKD